MALADPSFNKDVGVHLYRFSLDLLLARQLWKKCRSPKTWCIHQLIKTKHLQVKYFLETASNFVTVLPECHCQSFGRSSCHRNNIFAQHYRLNWEVSCLYFAKKKIKFNLDVWFQKWKSQRYSRNFPKSWSSAESTEELCWILQSTEVCVWQFAATKGIFIEHRSRFSISFKLHWTFWKTYSGIIETTFAITLNKSLIFIFHK